MYPPPLFFETPRPAYALLTNAVKATPANVTSYKDRSGRSNTLVVSSDTDLGTHLSWDTEASSESEGASSKIERKVKV